jgi:enoyl-CoA hydratase/carnithine racemase
MKTTKAADFRPENFGWQVDGAVATITLNRPDRKNPLTFESYAELRNTFTDLAQVDDVRTVIVTGAGGNFSSGGDVHEIIGPLTKMAMPELLRFTRMTGDLVKAMRACPQVIVAAVDGICAGAGACITMAADLRYGTETCKVGFLFTRVGLAGADMGACAILPRIIGHGRAAELFYSGRMMPGAQAHAWGFFNDLYEPDTLLAEAQARAREIADGPFFAHSMTKRMMDQEWSMALGEAIEHEAQAQAICMQTRDFTRAYEAFTAKQKPSFEGD